MRMGYWCDVQGSFVRDSSQISDRLTNLLERREGGLDILLGLLSFHAGLLQRSPGRTLCKELIRIP
jgi:hypothetical protein